MSIGDDDDITIEPAPAGEGVADGGANPGGHDGGADGSAAARVLRTAARTPAATTAERRFRGRGTRRRRREPRRPRRRRGRLGVVPEPPSADARAGPAVRALPLHQRPGRAVRRRVLGPRGPALPGELHGLQRPVLRRRPSTSWSAGAACARPSSGMAHEGDVLARRPVHRVRRVRRRGAPTRCRATRCWPSSRRARRSCCRACTGCGRRWSTSRGELVDELGHPAQVNAYVTPPSSQGFSPALRHPRRVRPADRPARSTGSSTRPCTRTRSRTRCGPTTARRCARGRPRHARHRPVLRPGDALYLPRGWIHSATALGDTSIHLTVGMSAYTRADVVDTLLAWSATPQRCAPRCRWASTSATRTQLAPDRRARPSPTSSPRSTADGPGRPDRATLGARFDRDTRPEPVAPLATLERDHGADRATPACGGAARYGGRVETAGDRVRLDRPGHGR